MFQRQSIPEKRTRLISAVISEAHILTGKLAQLTEGCNLKRQTVSPRTIMEVSGSWKVLRIYNLAFVTSGSRVNPDSSTKSSVFATWSIGYDVAISTLQWTSEKCQTKTCAPLQHERF